MVCNNFALLLLKNPLVSIYKTHWIIGLFGLACKIVFWIPSIAYANKNPVNVLKVEAVHLTNVPGLRLI